MKAKYIIINRAFPVLFHAGIEHRTEAAGRKVTSAGFVELVHVYEGNPFECSGRSDSLDIESNPERDAKIIAATFGGF